MCHHFENDTENIQQIKALLAIESLSTYPFSSVGKPTSNLSDTEFKELVSVAKQHCKRGDVFQLVLSRRTAQQFIGDEFNVYRALRSVNPSPYLFYFDYI